LLVFAAPAMAQDGTVGEGQVITDLATETEPPPGQDDGTDIPPVDDGQPGAEPEPDASGRRGEVHVLDSESESSAPPAPAVTPAAAPATPAPAATAAAPSTRARAAAGTLPFTGIDAAPLALIGLALLASGCGLMVLSARPA
jgi:hypothetical protein